MPQELKKKLIGFITDERGTISRQNLIKGAITLTAIAASVNVAYAGTHCKSQTETATNPTRLGGLSTNSERYNALIRQGLTDKKASTNLKSWNCEKDDYKTTCRSEQHCDPRTNHNTNTPGKYVHKNADAAMHTNNLNLDYNDKQAQFKGVHGHHGQHDKFDGRCKSIDHGNHCQHCRHSDGKM